MAPPGQAIQAKPAPKMVWVKTSKDEPKRPPLRDIIAAIRQKYVQKGWDTAALDELAAWLLKDAGEADQKVGGLQAQAVAPPNSAEKVRVFQEVLKALTAKYCDPKKNGSDKPERPPLRDIIAAIRQKYVQKGWDTTALDELAQWLLKDTGEADQIVGGLQGQAVADPDSAEKVKVFLEVLNAMTAQLCGYELRPPKPPPPGSTITVGGYFRDYLKGTAEIGVGHSSIPHQDEIPYYLRQLTPSTLTIDASLGNRGNVDPTDDYFTIIGKDNPLLGDPVKWLEIMAFARGGYGLGLGFLSKDELENNIMHRAWAGVGVKVRAHPWDKKIFTGLSFDYSLDHNDVPYPNQDFPNHTSHKLTPGFELGSNWNTDHITTSLSAQLEYTDIRYADETFPYTFTDADKLALWLGIPFKLAFSETTASDEKDRTPDITGYVGVSPYGFIDRPSVAERLGIYEKYQEGLISWRLAAKASFPKDPIVPWDITLRLSQDYQETRDTRTKFDFSGGIGAITPGTFKDWGKIEPRFFLVDNIAPVEGNGETQVGGALEYTIPGGAVSIEANVSGIIGTPDGDIPVGGGQIWFRPFNLF